MKRLIVLSFAAMAVAAPAYAGPAACSSAPASKWQPKAKLEKMLTAKGFKIRNIKVEKGCYEVYAVDKHGVRANMAFNAETLKMLKNAEAGEG